MIMKNFKVFCPFKHKGTHKGVDLIPQTTAETPEITAYDDGEVIFTQNLNTVNKSTGTAGMGTCIAIRHKDCVTRYQHLKYNSLKVKVGDKVKKGQPIAIYGRPTNGNSTGSHLHFDISYEKKPSVDYVAGKFMGVMRYYVNPIPYIEKAEQPKAETKTKIVMVALNVRSGPGMNYPRLKVLAPGTVVNVLEERDGWTRIDINRWVATKHLK